MSMRERRRSERVRVRFPCELEFDGERSSGTVRDISAGGLSVECDRRIEEGEGVHVRLHPKGRPSVELDALVWNVRSMRRRTRKQSATRLGLVLSDAPDAFHDLLEPGSRVASPRPPAPEIAAVEDDPAGPATRRYRVRVQQCGSARTRTLLVFAESADEARASALVEAGSGWNLLEVVAR